MSLETQANTELLVALYHQANASLDDGDPHSALQWYGQCLAALRHYQLDDDKMLSAVLFGAGKTAAYINQVNSAVALCEAAADVQKRIGRSEIHADRIAMAASVVAILDQHDAAQRLYGAALELYQGVGAIHKAGEIKAALREIMDTLGERQYRKLKQSTAPMTPQRFELRSSGVAHYRLTINRDGWAHWEDLSGSAPIPTLTYVQPWNIVPLTD